MAWCLGFVPYTLGIFRAHQCFHFFLPSFPGICLELLLHVEHNSQVALSEAEAAGSRVTASALDMEKLLVELLGDGVGMTFNSYIWLYHVITMGFYPS